MLATPEAGASVCAAAKPCPANLGLIEFRSPCAMLAVTRPTLDKMANEAGFPKRIRLGRVYYVRLADLKNWVEAH
jgi:predicted DNA-binding transcriptional regulator AlpA